MPYSRCSNVVQHNEWKRQRRQYWRDMVRVYPETVIEDETNKARMNRGLPPQRWAVLESKQDGHLFEMLVQKELHHIFPQRITGITGNECVIEVWPWEHAIVDTDRRVNYRFVRWGRLE